MTNKLLLSAVIKFLLGVILVGLIIFLPAGSLDYYQGWVLMGILFVPMLIAGIIMIIKNPTLLASRLKAKEKQKEQDLVQKLSGLMFLVGFILAGLGYRFNWCVLPMWVTVISACLFILSYVMYAEVLRENTYLSRTIEVQEGQRVIDNGLYSIVRHPMYSATLVLFLSMPLVLGSIYAFVVFLAYPFIISFRIIHEEKFLEENLQGYKEYKQKVKYRLIPYIW